MFVGNGVVELSREELFKGGGVKSGVAVRMTEPAFDCPSLNEAAADGSFMLQNLPSIACGHALLDGDGEEPENHAHVLDMCAAPGGKTTHLAAKLAAANNARARVVAFDKSKNKVAQIASNAERQGLAEYIVAHVQDATKSATVEDAFGDGENLTPPFYEGSFSRIMLDAPCSALGQRPQFLNAITLEELDSFPRLQRKLFKTAASLLAPGGTLVYSTCTFTSEENEQIVEWACQEFEDLYLVPALEVNMGSEGIGMEDAENARKVRRFFVGGEEDTIGFFIAKFRKQM